MDEQSLVARVLQGESWWLSGMISVAWSIICNILNYEEQGMGYAEALELALTKYTGREEPGDIAKDIAALVHDPERFLRMAKKLGYHLDVEDPGRELFFCMGGLVDVEPNGWRDGDVLYPSPVRPDGRIDTIHLYFRHPAEPEPEPRPLPATLELGL